MDRFEKLLALANMMVAAQAAGFEVEEKSMDKVLIELWREIPKKGDETVSLGGGR